MPDLFLYWRILGFREAVYRLIIRAVYAFKMWGQSNLKSITTESDVKTAPTFHCLCRCYSFTIDSDYFLNSEPTHKDLAEKAYLISSLNPE